MRLLLVQPPTNPHTGAFAELILALRSAFPSLGATTDFAVNEPLVGEGINLVFGAHLLTFVGQPLRLPPNSVICNLEPMDRPASQGRLPEYLELTRGFPLWDYSPRNASIWRDELGHDGVRILRIGYVPQLRRIEPVPEQDVDVLFYGSINDRRRMVLLALQQAGLRVRGLYGAYGAVRDAWIARSKVVVNIQFHDSLIHEIVRTSYPLANRKVVVSECYPGTDVEPDVRQAIVDVPLDRLVAACVDLVRSDARRREVEEHGFEIFCRRDQVDYLRSAIRETAVLSASRIAIGDL